MAQELTSVHYWDQWWEGTRLDAPICAHWTEIGRNGYFLRAIERHTGKLNRKSVVEIGGALSNRLLAMTKWRNAKVAAIDYSHSGLERTRKMFEHNGCEVTLILSDVLTPDLGGEYDLVTHWGVLEHFTDPFPLLKRSMELTKPGGYVFFSMPQMLGPGAYLWRKWSPKSWPLHCFHSDQAIYSCFERQGWKCKRVFFGAPLIQIAPCETSGLLPSLLGKVQGWIREAGRLRIVPFDRGLSRISENRGFVAYRR